MAKYILKEMAEGMADGHKTLYPKMQTYSLHDYETVIKHMRDYANATHQSRSTASKDLRQIVADPTSGITTRGSHSHKVWIASN